MILAAALLAVALGIVGYFIRDDRQQLARFKALDTSAARQRQYRIWTANAFAIFIGATLGGLALLVPIIAHVLIDLNALVLRPAISGAWRS